MENYHAFATLLCVILLLEVKWRFLSPLKRRVAHDNSSDENSSSAVNAEDTNIVRSTAQPVDSETHDMLASVMAELKKEDAVTNIFLEDEDYSTATPSASVQRVRSKLASTGKSWALNVSEWLADPEQSPQVIQNFDTDYDCIVVCGDDAVANDLSVKMTRNGIPVLCLGNATLASFPAMVGSDAIEIVVAGSVAA